MMTCDFGNDIVVQISQTLKTGEVDKKGLERLVRGLCGRFEVNKAVVSIAIVGDGDITKVNKRFLGLDSVTDVISFDLSDNSEQTKTFELVVNMTQAEREAKSRGHSVQAEVALYVVHGLLHNLGFNDSEQTEAEKMHGVEDDILQKFGYGVVYGGGSAKAAD